MGFIIILELKDTAYDEINAFIYL